MFSWFKKKPSIKEAEKCKPLVVRAGEFISCENGHNIYRITHDARSMDVMLASYFEPCEGVEKPKVGDSVKTKCPFCGARVFIEGPWNGYLPHVNGEWRGQGVWVDEAHKQTA